MHVVAAALLPLLSLFVPFHVFLPLTWVAVSVLIVMEAARFASPKANRWFIWLFRHFLRPAEKETAVAASTWVALSTAIAFTVFDYSIAFLAVCFLAFGDPAAGLVGQKWGRTRIWRKTIEGSAAFLVAALSIGVLAAYTVVQANLMAVVAGGFVAAIVEMAPLRVNDNMSIPLVSGSVMMLISAVLRV